MKRHILKLKVQEGTGDKTTPRSNKNSKTSTEPSVNVPSEYTYGYKVLCYQQNVLKCVALRRNLLMKLNWMKLNWNDICMLYVVCCIIVKIVGKKLENIHIDACLIKKHTYLSSIFSSYTGWVIKNCLCLSMYKIRNFKSLA